MLVLVTLSLFVSAAVAGIVTSPFSTVVLKSYANSDCTGKVNEIAAFTKDICVSIGLLSFLTTIDSGDQASLQLFETGNCTGASETVETNVCAAEASGTCLEGEFMYCLETEYPMPSGITWGGVKETAYSTDSCSGDKDTTDFPACTSFAIFGGSSSFASGSTDEWIIQASYDDTSCSGTVSQLVLSQCGACIEGNFDYDYSSVESSKITSSRCSGASSLLPSFGLLLAAVFMAVAF